MKTEAEAEAGVMRLHTKNVQDSWQPQNQERQGTDSPSELPEGTNLADHLILDFWLQSWERISICGF